MRYDHGSRENRQRAAFLFGKLKLQVIDASGTVEKPTTMQAATSSPHWRISNIAGVHVYRTAVGWNADIAFKDLPIGVPALVGNAVPCGSRDDALASAIRQLSMCVEREKVLMAGFDTRLVYFVFDEIEVPIDPDYLPDVRAAMAREGHTLEEALGKLAHLRHVVGGDGPLTKEGVDAADEDTRAELCKACEIAMALGRTQFSLEDGVWSDYAPAGPAMH